MIRLTDEEITQAYYNAWNQEYEYQYEKKDEDKCHALGREAVAKAQLKKAVDELKDRAEIEHEHCGNDCAHRGVSIWFDIYDWQALLEEVKE